MDNNKVSCILLFTAMKDAFNCDYYNNYEDEDIASCCLVNMIEQKQKTTPKIRMLQFTEKIVPQMNSFEFKSHFRYVHL